MRNFTNRERDKLPVVFVHPPVRVLFDPFVSRLIWCNQLLRARLEGVERSLKMARERLGWSE